MTAGQPLINNDRQPVRQTVRLPVQCKAVFPDQALERFRGCEFTVLATTGGAENSKWTDRMSCLSIIPVPQPSLRNILLGSFDLLGVPMVETLSLTPHFIGDDAPAVQGRQACTLDPMEPLAREIARY